MTYIHDLYQSTHGYPSVMEPGRIFKTRDAAIEYDRETAAHIISGIVYIDLEFAVKNPSKAPYLCAAIKTLAILIEYAEMLALAAAYDARNAADASSAATDTANPALAAE